MAPGSRGIKSNNKIEVNQPAVSLSLFLSVPSSARRVSLIAKHDISNIKFGSMEFYFLLVYIYSENQLKDI